MDWYDLKTLLVDQFALSRDMLHVYAAVTLHLLTAAVLRRSLAHPAPWLVVLAVALLNEWLDIRHGGGWPAMAPASQIDTISDLANSMGVPTILLLTARFAPRLMTDRRQAEAPSSADPPT